MNDQLNKQVNQQDRNSEAASDFQSPKIDYVVYRDTEDQPMQSQDLLAQIKNQISTLKEMHQRKLFLMREIKSIRHR